MSEKTKSPCGHYRGLKEMTTEEMSIQTFPKTVSDGADVRLVTNKASSPKATRPRPKSQLLHRVSYNRDPFVFFQ